MTEELVQALILPLPFFSLLSFFLLPKVRAAHGTRRSPPSPCLFLPSSPLSLSDRHELMTRGEEAPSPLPLPSPPFSFSFSFSLLRWYESTGVSRAMGGFLFLGFFFSARRCGLVSSFSREFLPFSFFSLPPFWRLSVVWVKEWGVTLLLPKKPFFFFLSLSHDGREEKEEGECSIPLFPGSPFSLPSPPSPGLDRKSRGRKYARDLFLPPFPFSIFPLPFFFFSLLSRLAIECEEGLCPLPFF